MKRRTKRRISVTVWMVSAFTWGWSAALWWEIQHQRKFLDDPFYFAIPLPGGGEACCALKPNDKCDHDINLCVKQSLERM